MELVGVPFDLCGARLGSRLGPAAVRLAGLSETLRELGFTVTDRGDVQFPPIHENPVWVVAQGGGLKHYDAAVEACSALYDRVLDTLNGGRKPLVIGGDHSVSIGSVGAALTHYGSEMAVLWVDAHADLNTPDTSPSGNMHGMTLGCLLHEETTICADQWSELRKRFVPNALRADRVGWLGIRDLDAGEKGFIAKFPREYTATMSDIDRRGLMAEIDAFDQWMRKTGAKHLWMSFDVDVLDPFLAPGTGTAVRGGLTYREMHLLGERMCELLAHEDCPYELVGLDVVETNPLFDTYNATAKVAVEFIASLFGKTILGV